MFNLAIRKNRVPGFPIDVNLETLNHDDYIQSMMGKDVKFEKYFVGKYGVGFSLYISKFVFR